MLVFLTNAAYYGLGICTPCLCGALVLFFVYPNYMLKLLMRFRRYSVGMKINYVKDNDFVFCYGEKNKAQSGKTSVVLIHGFTASKDQWLTNFKDLPSDVHLVAPDLPGHGDSSTPPLKVIPDIDFAVERLNKFLDLAGFKDQKVHLVGSSLGGAIVGIFSALHPERVEKVTMVSPAGVETVIEREFMTQMKRSASCDQASLSAADCPLLPQTLLDTKKMFDLCCFTQVSTKIHDQIWKGVMMLRLNKNEFFLRLFKTLADPKQMNMLGFIAPKISMPSQIIWGEDDQLFHNSGAELLKSALPDCRHMDVIDKCGHAVDIDRPGAYNKILTKFIQEETSKIKSENKKIANNSKAPENERGMFKRAI